MEQESPLTVNSQPSTVEQKTPTTVHGSSNSFLATLLSILLLISCVIAGFFAWQTQNLVKELTVYRQQPTETPTPTPDPTTDWQTYINDDYGFSIMYPSELDVTATEVNISKNEAEINQKCKAGTFTGCGGARWPDNKISFIRSNSKVAFSINIWNLDVTETLGGILHETNTYNISIFPYAGEYGETDPIDETTMNNIFSTIKFMEPEASTSPLPVACTMEAKICPDGSAVGRSGPKCEFAPCPTPKN